MSICSKTKPLQEHFGEKKATTMERGGVDGCAWDRREED
jgi:hypothetical protein